ncbi:hypothetical protein ABE093_09630 [Solilutibacter silvestris]
MDNGTDWIADTAFFDHPIQRGYFFRTTTETDTGDADSGFGVLINPDFGLFAQFEIGSLDTLVEAVGAPTIDSARKKAVLSSDALFVSADDVLIFCLDDLIMDLGDGAPMFGGILAHAVAGAIERGDVQALMRIVGVQQDRHLQFSQLIARCFVLLQISRGGLVLVDLGVIFAKHTPHLVPPQELNTSCCRP